MFLRLSKSPLIHVNHIFVISYFIVHLLIRPQINRDLLTTMASYDCYKAMVVKRYMFVYSLVRRKKLRPFCSICLAYKE